ncbi:sulfotransferase [Kytococcus sedentarius]|uniref:sulfotransferase n=1 Tax=Kytococcus sedentarius TaxID=1276 RepID=UPI003879A1B1
MRYAAKDDSFEAVLARANSALYEEFKDDPAPATQYPIGNIVGLPRSGTTVLFQLLAATGQVGYPSNLAAFFWRSPALGAHLQRQLGSTVSSLDLTSLAGRTPGPMGPHEFGYFWRAALGHTRNHEERDAEPWPADELNRQLQSMANAFGAPVVHKNFLAMLHLDEMAAGSPDLRFIALRRPLTEIASSLLAVRERIGISPSEDFGLGIDLESHGCSVPADDALARVAHQVIHLEEYFEACAFDQRDDSLLVDYSALSEDPRGTILNILGLLDIQAHEDAVEHLPDTLATRPPSASDSQVGHAIESAREQHA